MTAPSLFQAAAIPDRVARHVEMVAEVHMLVQSHATGRESRASPSVGGMKKVLQPRCNPGPMEPGQGSIRRGRRGGDLHVATAGSRLSSTTLAAIDVHDSEEEEDEAFFFAPRRPPDPRLMPCRTAPPGAAQNKAEAVASRAMHLPGTASAPPTAGPSWRELLRLRTVRQRSVAPEPSVPD